MDYGQIDQVEELRAFLANQADDLDWEIYLTELHGQTTARLVRSSGSAVSEEASVRVESVLAERQQKAQGLSVALHALPPANPGKPKPERLSLAERKRHWVPLWVAELERTHVQQVWLRDNPSLVPDGNTIDLVEVVEEIESKLVTARAELQLLPEE